jgi:twitching motility protein PilT
VHLLAGPRQTRDPQPAAAPVSMQQFDENAWRDIVAFIHEKKLTDLWINPGFVSGRQDGLRVRISEEGALTENDTTDLIRQLFYQRPDLLAQLREPMPEIDFSVSILGTRFRVNVGTAQGKLFAAMRVLPDQPPEPSEIDLDPIVVKKLINAPKGLVLLTGQSGSGKTTSLACLIEQINLIRRLKIITIEDPIEFLFEDKLSEITQREIGKDIPTFSDGLTAALRQSANVILCGEIRDEQSAVIAMKAAETGHLVFSTLHTSGAGESINRLLNMLPGSYPEARARSVISGSLLAVIDQRLLARRGGGRVAAREICIVNGTVQAKIRSKNEITLVDDMRAGRAEGMIDLNTSLDRIRNLVEPAEYERHYRKMSVGR